MPRAALPSIAARGYIAGMKKLYFVLLVAGGLYYAYEQSRLAPSPDRYAWETPPAGTATFNRQHVGRQVQGQGRVSRILADDNRGSRHQRFILTLVSGQTLLIAHNIDLAPRIAGLEVGDTVAFYGEYEWNDKGGVVHWTHRDPQGRHAGGWLEHEGRKYE